jgi:hypothetical protein
MSRRRFRLLSLLLCLGFFSAAYLPFAGRFLRTDDFARIQDNASMDGEYLEGVLVDNKSDGFYRPLNHLSFGVTYRLFGMHALPYGLFNAALVLACAFLFFRILELVSGSSTLACVTTLGWLLNIKPISSSLFWAVGRTSSMYTFFLALGMFAVLRPRGSVSAKHTLLALACLACALASKESAVIGAPLLLLTLGLRWRQGTCAVSQLVLAVLGSALIYLAYFLLRSRSGAMQPLSAPSFYRFEDVGWGWLDNFRSYLGRSLTFSALIALPLLLPQGRAGPPRRLRGRGSALRVLGLGLGLFTLTLAPMIAVPSRSDLYAFFPSVFVVATLALLLSRGRGWPSRGSERGRLLVWLFATALLVLPVAWARGHRTAEEHGGVYRWSWSIFEALEGAVPDRIALRFDPQALPERWEAGHRLQDLEVALELLLRRPVTVELNEPEKATEGPPFELIPDAEAWGGAIVRRRGAADSPAGASRSR